MTTPQGTFDLGFAFGVESGRNQPGFLKRCGRTPIGLTILRPHYNMWQNGTAGRDWDSAETLIRSSQRGTCGIAL